MNTKIIVWTGLLALTVPVSHVGAQDAAATIPAPSAGQCNPDVLIAGTVVVEPDGEAKEVDVTQSTGDTKKDAAFVEKAKAVHWSPKIVNGQPVEDTRQWRIIRHGSDKGCQSKATPAS